MIVASELIAIVPSRQVHRFRSTSSVRWASCTRFSPQGWIPSLVILVLTSASCVPVENWRFCRYRRYRFRLGQIPSRTPPAPDIAPSISSTGHSRRRASGTKPPQTEDNALRNGRRGKTRVRPASKARKDRVTFIDSRIDRATRAGHRPKVGRGSPDHGHSSGECCTTNTRVNSSTFALLQGRERASFRNQISSVLP